MLNVALCLLAKAEKKWLYSPRSASGTIWLFVNQKQQTYLRISISINDGTSFHLLTF